MVRTAPAAFALLALIAPAPRRAARPAPARAGAPFRLVLAPSGNEARWRVRERLASFDFPNDAIGTTRDIGGAIVVGADGKPVAKDSKITVNLTTLKSDRDMRDRYVQHRTLETDRFPTATLVPTDFLRMRSPMPDTGSFTFELVGDLTVHGVTKPTTWLVTAVAKDGGFAGTAQTRVTFEDFGMTQPRVPILLSIEDEINLEFQFNFVRDPAFAG
ncbi:MAG TPA: YceI family protein [Gemmatimonadales bacterium]|nr:YceI family protein [Gemmatimonadales bacterium]